MKRMFGYRVFGRRRFDMGRLGLRDVDMGRMGDRAVRTAQTLVPRGMRAPVARAVPAAMRVASSVPLWVGIGVASAILLPLLLRRNNRHNHARARTVGQVMVSPVLTVDTSATLKEAAQRMREGNVGALPVVEGGKLRGLVTDRDLVVRAMALGVDPSSTRVGDCATTNLLCARPEWGIEEAMRVMGESRIGRLPVVDDQDRPIGMVTLGSLALRSPEDEEALETAKQLSRRSARVA